MVSVDGSVSVSTDSPTEIGHTSAMLEGTLTDLGDSFSAEAAFEWGPATSELDRTTNTQMLSSTGSVTAELDDLVPGTTYVYRLVAVGTNGSHDTGIERQLTTTTPTMGVEFDQTLLPRDANIVNASYESEHSGYTGDGFVTFRESDSYVEWEIETEVAGEFGLTVQYALDSADRTGLLTAGDSQREMTVQSTGE